MSKTNHTPGPWQVAETQHHGQTLDIVESSTARILARTFINTPFPEQVENARLIAAAPDLLAALKACRVRLERLGDTSMEYQNAVQAIEKATEPA